MLIILLTLEDLERVVMLPAWVIMSLSMKLGPVADRWPAGPPALGSTLESIACRVAKAPDVL
jgi:hypothetical protein